MDEQLNEEATFAIVERAPAPSETEIETAIAEIVPSAEQNEETEIELVTAMLARRKAHYLHRVSVIEQFLGFAQSEADLAVRMARIEKFVGIGG